MSDRWTHVAGVARINSSLANEVTREMLENKFGTNIPNGTEGNLNISIWENPDKYDINKFTVSVFGSLCEGSSPEYVVKWFRDCLESFWVRNATIVAECVEEGTTISWNNKEKYEQIRRE